MVDSQRRMTAIVPARAGSKGIVGKNIIPVNGRALIEYSFEAASFSKSIQNIVVTTDDERVEPVAAQFSKTVYLNRPENLATDEAPMDSVIHHVLTGPLKHQIEETIILLQPTSPLRTDQDIESAFHIYNSKESQMVMSVYQVSPSYAKLLKTDSQGFLTGVLSGEAPFLARQLLPPVYMPNGAIYIFDRNQFLKNGHMPRQQILPFVMPIERSLDIDEPSDLEKAENYLRNKK